MKYNNKYAEYSEMKDGRQENVYGLTRLLARRVQWIGGLDFNYHLSDTSELFLQVYQHVSIHHV